jgi:hypothetical protein
MRAHDRRGSGIPDIPILRFCRTDPEASSRRTVRPAANSDRWPVDAPDRPSTIIARAGGRVKSACKVDTMTDAEAPLPEGRDMATNRGRPTDDPGDRPSRRFAVHPSLFRLFLGGFAGTVANALILFFLEPTIVGRNSGLARFLGAELSTPHGLGIVLFHFFNGAIIFPLGFAFFAARVQGLWLLKGLMWGTILWLAAGLVVMPMSGFGFFGYTADGLRVVASTLVGHLVYGGLQGLIAEIPARDDDRQARTRRRIDRGGTVRSSRMRNPPGPHVVIVGVGPISCSIASPCGGLSSIPGTTDRPVDVLGRVEHDRIPGPGATSIE